MANQEQFHSTERNQTSSQPKGTPAYQGLRIILAEPEKLISSAVRMLLEATGRYQIVAEAHSIEELLRSIGKSKTDVIIAESNFPGRSTIDFLYEMKRREITIPTIILSTDASSQVIKQAVLAGAKGYVLKRDDLETLNKAIETVYSGNTWFSPEIASIAGSLDAQITRERIIEPSDPLGALSPREREIFHLLADGLQNAAIARQLYISPRTVETHRARIVRKLGLHSNADLIRYAIRNGLSAV